ncbi:hypothetical protein E4Z66_04055 [Aliishimia ponticola]|uniref:Uncharacterized protein n=1 Tax=Aliishimia ponticola TaxID=2499833 RepID=A0A4S4NJ24_9RHOB|nr:hypothetical protein [Aliishimia ponticola]THH38747.1 hypothetical protein E4Z66_04055 [Aliishimia ponticola]
MRRLQDFALLTGLLAIVAIGTPAAALWQAARTDAPSDLWVVLTFSPEDVHRLALETGGHPVGPFTAPFATLIQTTPETLSSLQANSSWMIPANKLRSLCAPALEET